MFGDDVEGARGVSPPSSVAESTCFDCVRIAMRPCVWRGVVGLSRSGTGALGELLLGLVEQRMVD